MYCADYIGTQSTQLKINENVNKKEFTDRGIFFAASQPEDGKLGLS